MNSLSAFKSYDIRGIWQTEIDEEFCIQLWYAFVSRLLESNSNPKILIVSDVRSANTQIIQSLAHWFALAGLQQVDNCGYDSEYPQYPYGICSTSVWYYLGMQDYDVTIIVTASHNSKEYVWLKIVDKQACYFTTKELKAIFQSYQLPQIHEQKICTISRADLKYKIETLFTLLNRNFNTLKRKSRFVVDYGHGAGVHYEQKFLNEYFWDNIVGLFTNPDGEFPAHETDTSRFANYDELISQVSATKADFGIMFDGDVDRYGFVTSDWKVIKWDVILAIVAHQLLIDGSTHKLWSNMIYQEVFCGNIVREVVEWNNGELRITRVGRWAFAAEVSASWALIAGEQSGHLIFKELGYIEMPLLVLYYVLKESELYNSFDDMIAAYSKNIGGQILHFATDDKDAVIWAIASDYTSYPTTTVDGIRVQLPNGWFCIRKSWTEPIIKLALEADSQENFDALLRELRNKLKNLGCHEE